MLLAPGGFSERHPLPAGKRTPPLRVARLWSPGPSHAGRPRSRGGHTLGPGSHAGGAVSGVKAASRCPSHGLSGQQAPTRQVFATRPCPRPSAKFLSSSSGCRLALQGSAPLWGPHLGSRLEGPLAPRGATHFPLPPLQGCPVSPLSARAAGRASTPAGSPARVHGRPSLPAAGRRPGSPRLGASSRGSITLTTAPPPPRRAPSPRPGGALGSRWSRRS